METGRLYSMPNNPNNILHNSQSILLLEDGFCFCTQTEKSYFPYTDFGLTVEDSISSFMRQKSVNEKTQLILLDTPTIIVPSLNFDEALLTAYWKPYAGEVKKSKKLASHTSTNSLVKFVYSYPKSLVDKHSNLIPIPSFSLLYDRIIENSQSNFNKQIYIHLFQSHFDLFVTQGTRILLANRFPHKNEEDFMYYLFYASEQLQLSENSCPIFFLGDYVQYKHYYEGVKNFQSQIEFLDSSSKSTVGNTDPAPYWNA